jgi:hypothetical protein
MISVNSTNEIINTSYITKKKWYKDYNSLYIVIKSI